MTMKMKNDQSDRQASMKTPLGLRHISIAFVMTVAIGVISILFGYYPTNILLFDSKNIGNSNENNSTTAIIPSSSSSSSLSSLSESMGGFHKEGRNMLVPECCCTFIEIEEVNRNTVYPLLKKVVETPFFAHFKIDLCSSCELWHDMPLCTMKDCSVCECENPPTWSFDGIDHKPNTGPDPDCTAIADDNVVTTVESYVIDGWTQSSPSSSSSEEEAFNSNGFDSFLSGEAFPSSLLSDPSNTASVTSTTAQVVDLRLNPEGYTGYTGKSSEKVWSAIHSVNCFQPAIEEKTHNNKDDNNNNTGTESPHDDQYDDDDDQYCNLSSEQRLYNRFISGLHSSISLHIAHSYCLEMSPTIVGECQMWGLNDTMAYDRVLKYPDRVENLYVAFSLLLRAVVKAGVAISAAVPEQLDDIHLTSTHPGDDDDDDDDDDSLLLTTYWSESLLPELMALPQKCPNTFNESSLLSDILDNDGGGSVDNHDESTKARKSELQRRFQHLTSIMQCVGCDRCKLWGTLQTLGIGTALRILFHNDDANGAINLSRQEAVALVNTLERLSSSLVFAYEFRKRREERTKLFPSSLPSSSSSCSPSS
jgi:ERO1-like protein alpha